LAVEREQNRRDGQAAAKIRPRLQNVVVRSTM
jgi:hypothetical protein